MFVKCADIAVTISLPEEIERAEPGMNIDIKYKLDKPLNIGPGAKFTIREGNKTIAIGDVASVQEESLADLEDKKEAKDQKKKKQVKGKH